MAKKEKSGAPAPQNTNQHSRNGMNPCVIYLKDRKIPMVTIAMMHGGFYRMVGNTVGNMWRGPFPSEEECILSAEAEAVG